jgi:hypothetical protein
VGNDDGYKGDSEMQKHKLTQAQAKRLNRTDLAGKTVEVTLYQQSEMHKKSVSAGVIMAKDVWYQGKRIGGTLQLDK